MSDVLKKLVEGIQELFPEAEEIEITTETRLEEIPDWDSMAAVNLQSYIEQTFEVAIAQDLLNEEATIGEVIGFIEHPETMGEAA